MVAPGPVTSSGATTRARVPLGAHGGPGGAPVVVAQDGHGGDFDDGHFAREAARFLGEPVVGQIAADHEDVGALVDLTK